MKVLIFTGFLGSGKTSMILSFARFLKKQNQSAAFIVNEAGNLCLDSKVIGENGSRVEEVFSGCICCQLPTDFIKALKNISAEEDVDVVILEASGVADPSRLLDLLSRYGYPGSPILQIVDLARLMMLYEATPLLGNGLKTASLILGNKKDLVASSDDLDAATALIGRINSKATLYLVSAKDGVPDALWQEVMKL